MSELPLEDVLASLDLSRAEPGIGLLQALFARFNAKVPFETASKIERDADVADPASKPRVPEIFWHDHLELGAGGTCFARVAAFQALLDALGFSSRKVLGRVAKDLDHAALIVETGGRGWLCDVGFPLPALLPSGPCEQETALGRVRAEATTRGLAIDLGGVPEGPRRVEVFFSEVPEEQFREIWRRTFRADSKFLAAVALRLQLENRAVSFAQGQVRVDDLHSRLAVPVPAPRAERLAEIFGVDRDLLSRAFARVGDTPPRESDATLTAYLELDADPQQAFAAIASPAGYRRLLEGVAEVTDERTASDGWTVSLAPPSESPAGPAALEDRVTPDAGNRRLGVVRASASTRSESFFEVVQRGGAAYLTRTAKLSGPREDLLRNDSLRGRLAAGLAVDLLAWTRLIGP